MFRWAKFILPAAAMIVSTANSQQGGNATRNRPAVHRVTSSASMTFDQSHRQGIHKPGIQQAGVMERIESLSSTARPAHGRHSTSTMRGGPSPQGTTQVFVVTTTADTGSGSLRKAIHDANVNPGLDYITFSIGSGVQSILPSTAYEVITSPVIIDGTTQPGYAGAPVIQLDGTLLANQFYDNGLEIDVAGSTVKGLAINRFAAGIVIDGSGGDTIQGNYIGTDPTGSIPYPNFVVGVQIFGPGNLIGGTTPGSGNVISANGRNIEDDGSSSGGYGGSLIQGNIIGLDRSGTLILQNNGPVISNVGIFLYEVTNDTIGGIGPGARNIISGNVDGIYIGNSPGTSNEVIQGNYIGLDITGTFAPGNTRTGIRVWAKNGNLIGGLTSSATNVISGNMEEGIALRAGATGNLIEGNIIGTDVSELLVLGNGDGVLVRASNNNTIGGSSAGAGNFIGGNLNDGISLDTAAGTLIQGNLVGAVLKNGSYAPMGNDVDGILIYYSPRNTIGGIVAGSGNTVGFNSGNGIVLSGDSAVQNVIEGNAIGTDGTGTMDLRNGGDGVQINGSRNTIGGSLDAQKNFISHNAGTGVYILNGQGNLISHNSISSNGLLGIDIDPPRPNPNDPLDADAGPNQMQNFPVLDSVFRYTSTTVVKGHLNSAPGASYNVELYQNAAGDTSGYGEGEAFIGGQTVATDGSGNATFAMTIPFVVAPGKVITSTATDIAGNTSEFSRCLSPLKITRPQPGELWISGDVDTIRWTVSGATEQVSLRYSVDDGKTFQLISLQQPALPGSFIWTLPTEILSKKCRVSVSDLFDPTTVDTSGRFKIKGYELTKDSADEYVRYQPDRHGWPFKNSSPSMWPPTWYSQFNYQLGDDPYSGDRYPELIRLRAMSSDFPDWPLFVETFGTDQCYFLPTTTVYKPSAIELWLSVKEKWTGSCFGFAVSSFLAFDDSLTFIQRFTDIGAYTQLFDFGISDIRRREINRLMESQDGIAHVKYRRDSESKLPMVTLGEVKQMLISDNKDRQVLILVDQHKSESHAVNPYKVSRDLLDPSLMNIEVYDNNDPGGYFNTVIVDSILNTWSYTNIAGWGGSEGLYLSEPMSQYLITPQISSPAPARQLAARASQASRLTLFSSSGAAIRIADSSGHAIGFADSNAFNALPGAYAIIPLTGGFHPPIGYTLPPSGKYSVAMQSFSDTATHLGVFADSSVFSFTRSGVHPAEADRFRVAQGFDVVNPDNVSKTASLTSIIIQPDNEKVVALDNALVPANDSVHFEIANRQNLTIANYGDLLRYDVRVQHASATDNSLFTHAQLSIPPNSTAQIIPVWTDIVHSHLKIRIDHGNDGSFEDSLSLLNDALGWANDQNQNNPICLAPTNQEHPVMVSDGAGGAIAAWDDGRSNGTDIYAQRLDSRGRPLWAADGISLCDAMNEQIFPVITTDMRGGAFVAWDDDRSGLPNSRDVYFQWVDSTGSLKESTSGEPACNAAGIQGDPHITSDSLGGAYIAWEDNRPGWVTIFAQHVSDSGFVKWGTGGDHNGLRVAWDMRGRFSMIGDGEGGVVIVWTGDRQSGTGPGMLAQRLTAAGQPLWGPDGATVFPDSLNGYNPTITRGAGMSWIIAAEVTRNGSTSGTDIYVQRLDSTGAPMWSPGGVPASTARLEQYQPILVGDRQGGAVVTWTDNRNSDSLVTTSDIYAQRIDANGNVLWTNNGVAVTLAHNNQLNPAIVPDGLGGAVIAWEDSRSDTSRDIYAQRISANGAQVWDSGGVPISTAPYDQYSIAMLSDGQAGAFLAWEDLRSGVGLDIYGQHVSHDGSLGDVTLVPPVQNRVQTYALEQNYPNPFNPSTTIEYSLPVWTHVKLEVFNMLGQKVGQLVDEEQGPGKHAVRFNAGKLASGVYIYRLQAKNFVQAKKLLLLK